MLIVNMFFLISLVNMKIVLEFLSGMLVNNIMIFISNFNCYFLEM